MKLIKIEKEEKIISIIKINLNLIIIDHIILNVKTQLLYYYIKIELSLAVRHSKQCNISVNFIKSSNRFNPFVYKNVHKSMF